MTTTSRRKIIAFALGLVSLLVMVSIAGNAEPFESGEGRTPPTRDILPIEAELGVDATETRTVDDPVELPEEVAIAIAIVLGLGALYLLSRQRFSLRFRRPSIAITRSAAVEITEEEEAEAIADFARDLIDELKEGDSPRYAIQRAYAAVETGFGAPELTRKPAETPLRYLDRIFGRHATVRGPLERLTGLFQQARFSAAPVDEPMRTDAIEALTEIRDYYTAVAWKKIANRRSKTPA